jgi:DNA-binding NtrC family response regulator
MDTAGWLAPGPEGAERNPVVCLGMGAPEGMGDFLARAGLELVPYSQRHHATLYVDFVGARPGGVEVLNLELAGKSGEPSRSQTHFASDNWQTLACFVLSRALHLKPLLVTVEPETLSVITSAISVATSHVPVIVRGEIGVGKPSLARLIHSASRCDGPMFTVNCGTLESVETDTVLDALGNRLSENQRPAREPIPYDATIFLDEIGELTDTGQLKLLHMLQTAERRAWPQPGASPTLALRFVAATNRPITWLVERGEFRKELYWRLNVFSLEIPPLRQRKADIVMLSRHFLRQANPRRVFTPMALKMLSNYAFPGNVLELESLVTRLAISPLASGNSVIDVADLRRQLMLAPATEPSPVSGWKSSREEARREMILKAIASAGGDRTEAARKLGISTRALQYHITKAGLSRRRRRPGSVDVPAMVLAGNPSQPRLHWPM